MFNEVIKVDKAHAFQRSHASVIGENRMDSTAQNSNDINRAIPLLPIKRLAGKQVSQSSKFYKLSTVRKCFKGEEQTFLTCCTGKGLKRGKSMRRSCKTFWQPMISRQDGYATGIIGS